MKGIGVFLLLQIGLSHEVNPSCTDIKNRPCIFPFKYDGWKYDECTTYSSFNGKAWCATKVDLNGTADCGGWGPALGNGECGECDTSKCEETSPTETLIECKPSKEEGIFCLNDDFNIPCQETQDCPDNYFDDMDKFEVGYFCHSQTRCVEFIKFPDCTLLENYILVPWCQECRECFLRSLDETGEFWSACKRETRTEECHDQPWSSRSVQDWLPDCSSHTEAGPWCNRCRQCWAAELLLGEQAKCWKNQGCDFGSWGPGLKTEWCPSNFKKAPCYYWGLFNGGPPKRISHTSGQSKIRLPSF